METLFFALISAIFFLVSPSWIHLGLFNLLYRSSLWEQRTGTISALLIGYGLIFLLISVLSYFSKPKGFSLTMKFWSGLRFEVSAVRKSALEFLRNTPHSDNHPIWIGLTLAIGLGIRAFFLSQPMRGDEAFTFLSFANREIVSLFDYPVPNNHVLNTFLIKATTVFFGASPATIRMPAFLAGAISIPLTFYLAKRQNPRSYSGLFAASSIAVFPYLILYSTNARGYSLIVLLTICCALVVMQFTQNPSWAKVCLLALLSSLGLLAIPSMIFSISGIFCWLVALLLIEKQPIKMILLEFAIPFGLLCGLFTFIFYTPVIIVSNGIQPIIANKFVESQNWLEFSAQILPGLRNAYFEITRDIPPAAQIIGLVLILFGLFHSVRARDWKTFLQIPTIIFGALLILLTQHTVPYSRLWIYLIPFFLILADYGFTFLIEHLIPGLRHFAIFAVILTSGLFAISLVSSDVITKYPDTSAFPEAQLVAQYLKPIITESDLIRVTNTADWPVYFYFWYYDVPYQFDTRPDNPTRTFIVVKKSRYSIEDMTDEPVIKLLDFEDMALYQVEER